MWHARLWFGLALLSAVCPSPAVPATGAAPATSRATGPAAADVVLGTQVGTVDVRIFIPRQAANSTLRTWR